MAGPGATPGSWGFTACTYPESSPGSEVSPRRASSVLNGVQAHWTRQALTPRGKQRPSTERLGPSSQAPGSTEHSLGTRAGSPKGWALLHTSRPCMQQRPPQECPRSNTLQALGTCLQALHFGSRVLAGPRARHSCPEGSPAPQLLEEEPTGHHLSSCSRQLPSAQPSQGWHLRPGLRGAGQSCRGLPSQPLQDPCAHPNTPRHTLRGGRRGHSQDAGGRSGRESRWGRCSCNSCS